MSKGVDFDRELRFVKYIINYYIGFIDSIDHCLNTLTLSQDDIDSLNKKKEDSSTDLKSYQERLHTLQVFSNKGKAQKTSKGKKHKWKS